MEDADGRRGYIGPIRRRATPSSKPTAPRSGSHRVERDAGTIPLPKPLWFDQQGDELGTPSIVMEMINGQSLVSVARQRDDSEHLAMALSMCDVGASIHGFDVSALPDHIEVPTSWDDYIEARPGARTNVDSNPFMR